MISEDVKAVHDAVANERQRLIDIVKSHRPKDSICWYYPWQQIDLILREMGDVQEPPGQAESPK